jgi:hypothetical protein
MLEADSLGSQQGLVATKASAQDLSR